jgi:NADP-dependent 3-hydroxy acid dehydrogenase YdfG
MTDRLSGCAALVTGASSGIGRATAAELAAHGAKVAVVGTAQGAAGGPRRLDRGGGRHGDRDRRRHHRRERGRDGRGADRGALRPLDILVNNAGVMLLGPTPDARLEDWKRMVDVNVLGVLYCTHAAVPHLLKAAEDGPRRVADLVNVSSIGGRSVRPGSQVYNLTKWGVGALSESMRQELASKHVRVSVIEPGATRTELQQANRPEILAQIRSRQDGFELLEPQDVADAIGYMVTRPRHINVNEIMVRPTEIA